MNSRKRVTIKDIARELGISNATVSRALSGDPEADVNAETRRKVVEFAAAMGYRPDLLARAMATRKSGTIGLLTYEITDPLYANYVQTIMQEAHSFGYQIVLELANSPRSRDPLDNEQVQIRQMLSRGIDGLLIQARGEVDEGKRILEAVEGFIPIVGFSHPVEGISCVFQDRAVVSYALTKHLIDLGRRKIQLIDMSKGPKWQGYLRAMEEHNLEPEWMPPDSAEPTLETGYRMGIRLARETEGPQALICWGDRPAIGICRGLQESGIRVPEDIAVVGFGNNEYGAYCSPPLTTVAYPVSKICKRSVQILMDRLDGKTDIVQDRVYSPLIIRESCGASMLTKGGTTVGGKIPEFRGDEGSKDRQKSIDT